MPVVELAHAETGGAGASRLGAGDRAVAASRGAPRGLRAGGPRPGPETPAPVPFEEIAVSDLPDGTRLVQLGAFDTAEIAREEWDRIAAASPSISTTAPA
jgi:hypothetical protein